MRRFRIVRSLVAIGCLAVAASASAQSFPTRPVRMLVGFGPGGVTDVVQRLMADEMGKRLGQPVVVENRPGASGLVAALAVKNAPPDGYLIVGGSITVVSPVYLSNGIVASKEMAPVATTALGDYFVYAGGNLGLNSIRDLVAWTKANPGKLRFGAAAASNTMLMAMIAKRTGITFENIPYKSSDQVIAGIIQGDAQITTNAAAGFTPHVQSGKLKIIASMSPQRLPNLPDVPTLTEQGVPMTIRFNHGLWGPLGTPRDAVMRMNGAVNEALKDPALAEKLRNLSLVVAPMSPEEMIKAYEQEMAFYTEAAALIGFKPQ